MSLGVVTIGPWALLLVYDLLFYVYRSCAYHIPFIGGKAQGKRRPRAPSLTERPSGRCRYLPRRRAHTNTKKDSREDVQGTAEMVGGF